MTHKLTDILREFCALPPNGDGALEMIAKYAQEKDKLYCDPLGSVILERNGGGELLLEAHLDTIGMIVREVLPQGFLRVHPVGSMDRRPLPAQVVTVWAKDGEIPGVVISVPPHLKEKDAPEVPEWNAILIDIGGVENRVKQGDLVSLYAPLTELENDCVSASGLDNRAGCAAILHALLAAPEKPVTAVFAVQEEIGGSGAKAAAFRTNAKQAIAVDVTFARAPDVKGYESCILGGGPALGYSPVLDRALGEKLQKLAEKNGIRLQHEVMGGRTNTDADNIQSARAGIPTALFSIPLRNMHTAAELVRLSDISDAAKLILEVIESF